MEAIIGTERPVFPPTPWHLLDDPAAAREATGSERLKG
jgi:hypothetical protein